LSEYSGLFLSTLADPFIYQQWFVGFPIRSGTTAGVCCDTNKNKRGGQQGNQNAREHGFFSSTRSPDEICRLQDIIAQESIDPEIAVLRVKFTVFGSALP